MTPFAFTSVGDKEIHNGRMHQTVIAAPESLHYQHITLEKVCFSM